MKLKVLYVVLGSLFPLVGCGVSYRHVQFGPGAGETRAATAPPNENSAQKERAVCKKTQSTAEQWRAPDRYVSVDGLEQYKSEYAKIFGESPTFREGDILEGKTTPFSNQRIPYFWRRGQIRKSLYISGAHCWLARRFPETQASLLGEIDQRLFKAFGCSATEASKFEDQLRAKVQGSVSSRLVSRPLLDAFSPDTTESPAEALLSADEARMSASFPSDANGLSLLKKFSLVKDIEPLKNACQALKRFKKTKASCLEKNKSDDVDGISVRDYTFCGSDSEGSYYAGQGTTTKAHCFNFRKTATRLMESKPEALRIFEAAFDPPASNRNNFCPTPYQALLIADADRVCSRLEEYQRVQNLEHSELERLLPKQRQCRSEKRRVFRDYFLKAVSNSCRLNGRLVDERCKAMASRIGIDPQTCATHCQDATLESRQKQLSTLVNSCKRKELSGDDRVVASEVCNVPKSNNATVISGVDKWVQEKCLSKCIRYRVDTRTTLESSLWPAAKAEIEAGCENEKTFFMARCEAVKRYADSGLEHRESALRVVKKLDSLKEKYIERVIRLSKTSKRVTLKYKRCMSAMDLSLTARRYAVTDDDLYEDFMNKAHKKCMRRSGCNKFYENGPEYNDINRFIHDSEWHFYEPEYKGWPDCTYGEG